MLNIAFMRLMNVLASTTNPANFLTTILAVGAASAVFLLSMLLSLPMQEAQPAPAKAHYTVSTNVSTPVFYAALLAGTAFATSPGIWQYATEAEVFALNNLLCAALLSTLVIFLTRLHQHGKHASQQKSEKNTIICLKI